VRENVLLLEFCYLESRGVPEDEQESQTCIRYFLPALSLSTLVSGDFFSSSYCCGLVGLLTSWFCLVGITKVADPGEDSTDEGVTEERWQEEWCVALRYFENSYTFLQSEHMR